MNSQIVLSLFSWRTAMLVASQCSLAQLLRIGRRENRPSLVAIVILSAFACVMVLLGAFSVWDGYHTGITKRGVHVVSQGDSARWLGGLQISVGLLMLGIAMPTKKVALCWMLTCVCIAFACLVMALVTK